MNRPMRKSFTALAAVVLAFGLTAVAVDAKPGRGSGSGSRGSRTDMSVPSTPTAPRTTTPQSAPNTTMPGRPAAPAAAAAAQAAKPSMMSTMAKGFAMGLIGAGLFGLLTGNGLFGGLSGMMGMLGLLLQVALIVLAARLIWGFFRNRQQQPQAAGGPDLSRAGIPQGGMAQPVAGGATQAAVHQPQPVEPQRADMVGVNADDYTAFQGVLNDLMLAYSNEDIGGIRRVATPDVAAQFIRELHENQSKGVINRLGQPQLLQGDLAESWFEDNVAYATVAMRFSLVDVTVDRASGNVVAGNPTQPQESTEIWTFRRDGAGRPWLLCGQQQA
jgi:predicted lipid-binding transport protein (Tim44 family)